MPKYDVTAPDGRVYEVNAPEGATQDDAIQYVQQNLYKPTAQAAAPEEKGGFLQGAKNLAAGGLRGAGSIGATLLAPVDVIGDAIAGKGLSLESNRQRRKDMDSALETMGAQPDSWLYQGGKLAGEIAGTAGAGGVLGNVAARAGAPAALVNSISSGGLNVAGKTGPIALATRAAGGALTGGATAGLADPSQAGMGAVVGGAFPVAAKAAGAAARGAGAALRGAPVSKEVADLATRAKALGINVPADRIANSKPLNAVAASLDYVPFSGRAATNARMESQLNTALSKTFGQNTDNVTMGLRKASDSLGGEFDRVLQSNTVKVDQQFFQDLAEHANRAAKELGSDGASVIKNQIDEIIAKGANGQIDGQAAYNIKRTLDRIGKRSTPEAFYALDLKRSLMGALDRSLGPKEAAAFAKTRQQYGNMLALEKIAKNGAEGEISVARLANMKNIRSPDLQELADISAQFLKSREGQHGALQRLVIGGTGLGAGTTLGALPIMGGIVAAGRGTNALLNSNMAKNAVLGGPMVPSPLIDGGLLGFSRVAPLLTGQ